MDPRGLRRRSDGLLRLEDPYSDGRRRCVHCRQQRDGDSVQALPRFLGAAALGASNTQINIHMSLWGETELRVRDTWQKMSAGDVVCFDDSYLHEVYNRGERERVAIVVRVMHPGMMARASDPGIGRVSAEL